MVLGGSRFAGDVHEYCDSNARQNNRFVVKGVQESEHQAHMIQMHVTTRRLLRYVVNSTIAMNVVIG